MQTVGIIGGAGFIGNYVTQKFLTEGYAVKASDPGQHRKVRPPEHPRKG
ncbi:hypothetical protein [Spirosoma areae]